MFAGIIIAIIFVFALVLSWHLIFPIMGGVVAIGAAAWMMITLAIAAVCAAILLVFIFSGIGLLLFGIGVFIAIIIAITFFPVLFPVLLPLFILFLIIGYIRNKHLKQIERHKKS